MINLQRFQFYPKKTGIIMHGNKSNLCGWGSKKEAYDFAKLISNDNCTYLVDMAENCVKECDFNISDAIADLRYNN